MKYYLSFKTEMRRTIKFTILILCFSISICNADQHDKLIIENAKKGDAEAQYILGLMYAAGEGGVTKNYRLAFESIKKSAEQGYIKAQIEMGQIYGSGDYGIAKNDTEAFKWYTKAADRGYDFPLSCLGSMYEYGRGTNMNYVKAYSHYSAAIKFGFWPAKDHLSALKEKMTHAQINEGEAATKELVVRLEKAREIERRSFNKK